MSGQDKLSYRVLLEGGEGEVIEKKSRFIATVRRADTEREAVAFIDEMKKKYWDARHNCSAFVIGPRAELTRCSDDGEPGGTAGRPMLEVLLGEGVRNAAVVVTRYFGGTLLGTGGLVRAYTQAVKEGLKHCKTGIMCYGCEVSVRTDYNNIGRILHILGLHGMEPVESEYTENVRLMLRLEESVSEGLRKELTEAANGRVVWTKIRELYFIVEKSV